MGRQKLLEPIDGRSLIQRALDASAAWPTVVVASDAVAAALAAAPARTGLRVVRNDEPERGMNHSLALADAAIDARRTDCGRAGRSARLRRGARSRTVVRPTTRRSTSSSRVPASGSGTRSYSVPRHGDASRTLRDGRRAAALARRSGAAAARRGGRRARGRSRTSTPKPQLEAYRRRYGAESKG